MKKNKIGILIVNYNNLNFTKNCIIDIFKQINQNFDLWVVDQNSSEIGTEDFLNELDNGLINVVRNNKNYDLNRVWNWFYDECESEYLCFLNNDVRLTNNFTDDIIKIFDLEPQVGAVIHVTNNLNFIKAEQKLNYSILNPPLYQGWDYTVQREAYTKIPDSLRIFGGDDFIFGNLNMKGYKTAMAYSSPIIHYKEKTRINLGNEIHSIQASDNKNYHIERQKIGFRHTDTTMGKMSNKYPPNGMVLTQNSNCIYTTIIGNYDKLPKLSVKKENNWDYICFTDNIDLISDVWKIIYVGNDGKTKLDNTKLSRHYKTSFPNYLLSYDNLIYCDARMEIIGDINQQLKMLGANDIVFMKHPQANSIKEEMKRVLGGRLESVEMVDKIKKRYEEAGYKYNNGLYAGGILLFRNNENTIKFFKEWWHEIENFSHRDQLSLNYVISKNPDLKVGVIGFMDVISKYYRQTARISKRMMF